MKLSLLVALAVCVSAIDGSEECTADEIIEASVDEQQADATNEANNAGADLATTETLVSRESVVLDALAAEIEQLDELMDLNQRKRAALQSMRQHLLESLRTDPSTESPALVPIDELLAKYFARKTTHPRGRPTVSAVHDAGGFDPIDVEFTSGSAFGRSFQDFVVFKTEAAVPAGVCELIIIPLAVYNPYSRSMSAGSGKAPHAELVFVVDNDGTATFYSSDGDQVSSLSVNPPGSTSRVRSVDYTFTQLEEKLLVVVLDEDANLVLSKMNVWFDHYPIVGAPTPVEATPGSAPLMQIETKSGPVHVATESNAYTVAVTPITKVPLASYDVDPSQVVLYSWRYNMFAIAATTNGTSFVFVNKTGHMRASINMLSLYASMDSVHDVSGYRINKIVQLGPRIALAFGNTIFFYHMERRGFESTRCMGAQQQILDFAFDAVTPAHVYATLEDSSVLVFDVTGKPNAANPCAVTRNVGARVPTNDEAFRQRGGIGGSQVSVDSVPGYFLRVDGEIISVFNASRNYVHVATSSSTDDADTVEDSSASPGALIRVSPVGRGWARKSDPGGDGNLIAVVSPDRTAVRFFQAYLPYTPEASDLSWMRYPMIAVTAVIVLFTMYHRWGRQSPPAADMPGFDPGIRRPSRASTMPRVSGRSRPPMPSRQRRAPDPSL